MTRRALLVAPAFLLLKIHAFQGRTATNDQLLQMLLRGDYDALNSNRRSFGPPGNSSTPQKSLAYFVWMICSELYEGSSGPAARPVFMSLDKSEEAYQLIKKQFNAWAKEHPRRVETLYGEALSEWLPSPSQDFKVKRDNMLRGMKLLNNAVAVNDKVTPVLSARYGVAVILSAYGDQEAGSKLQAYSDYKNQKEMLLIRPSQAKAK